MTTEDLQPDLLDPDQAFNPMELLAPPPEVRCAHTELCDPRGLVGHPDNPNQHPEEQLLLFFRIVCRQGWRRPITVSRRSGYVTRGHGALRMALRYGLAVVPVDRQDYADEQQELADVVADNQLARMAVMQADRLRDALQYLDRQGFDVELTAYSRELLVVPEVEQQQVEAVEAPAVPQSQTRMFQLFFDQAGLEEFLQHVKRLQLELGTANATDTILEVLRNADDRRQSFAESDLDG